MTLVRSNPVLVLNGDSLCEIDPSRLLRFHALKRARATVAVTHQEDRPDTGSVILAEDDRVLSIIEKPRIRMSGYDSAGIYVIDRAISSLFPSNSPWSLNGRCFPNW